MTTDQPGPPNEAGEEPSEVIDVEGPKLRDKVRSLIREGNVRRVAIKNAEGHTVLEIPVTIGVVGTIALPAVAAVGAIAGMAKDWKVEVYRREAKEPESPETGA